nr:hypothetical protein [Candidatus Freyarchaeota archaeon]
MVNRYQEAMKDINEEILDCPNYQNNGKCSGDLTHIEDSDYRHGPQIAYIGSKYGESEPRILFTRLNPPWYSNLSFFGNKESIELYKSENPDCTITDIHSAYLEGWKSRDGKNYRGIQDAGTVTGHPNTENLTPKELDDRRKKPLYGIQIIMQEMIEEKIFRNGEPLDFCAINNIIKCSGRGENYNPKESMERNCSFYEKEFQVLDPQILVVMGNETSRIIKKRFEEGKISYRTSENKLILYWELPHPRFRKRKGGWKGKSSFPSKQFPHYLQANPLDREFTVEKMRIYYDKDYLSILFNYVLWLVSMVKQYPNIPTDLGNAFKKCINVR